MRSPKSKLIPILAFFLLLASPTIQTLAKEQEQREVICLYRRAVEETKGPIQLEDLRAVELKTAADYNDIAQLCIDCEIYDKALETIEKALDLDPFDPVANLHAGLIHYKLGGYKEAAYHLEWALRAGGKAQRIRDVRLGEELLSGPATNPSKADLSIRNLLNEVRERAKDQETKNTALETREKTHALHHLNINTGSEPFLGGEDLSTGVLIEKGKEAVKAILKEGSRTVYPPPKQAVSRLTEGNKGPQKPSSSKEKGASSRGSEAGKEPSNKKGNQVKSAAVKEGEQEGAERFLLQPFNPERR